MGFERIVSVLQDEDSNYRTDLLLPIIQAVQAMTGDSDQQRDANFTPYRVIADHTRAAAFLIADGVVPGNIGRNYVCRMIIRRAARFGSKLGLHEPFLSQTASMVIENYGEFFPELKRNRAAILSNLTQEEERFQRTVESAMARLEALLGKLRSQGERILQGEQAFELYATFGLPLEITRDIARESDLDVDEDGFRQAMDQHRLASSAGEAFGPLGGEDVDLYRDLFKALQAQGKISEEGVTYNPYEYLEIEGQVLALVRDGAVVERADPGEKIEVLLPHTGFYIESGGQVSDTGTIMSAGEPGWEMRVSEMRKPAAGIIMHSGVVLKGHPRSGDGAIALVDLDRRRDIMRNHTATHLLHAELRAVLGEHARQAGSLVAPDRLRFDFTHSAAVTPQELEQIEAGVNQAILGNYRLNIEQKPLQQAISEGAIALFGEKYADTVRNITIGEPETFSNELCGGTHVQETGDIGIFLITGEGSVAAGIRRIEAVTGREAYQLVKTRSQALRQISSLLGAAVEKTPARVDELLEELAQAQHQAASLRSELAVRSFEERLVDTQVVAGVPVLALKLPDVDAQVLREMCDRFRHRFPSSVAVLGTVEAESRPLVVASVSEDLVKRGLNAGELVKFLASFLGGGGGGRPTLAQAGGKDASRLDEALEKVPGWVADKLG